MGLSFTSLLALSCAGYKKECKLQWPLDDPVITQNFGENKTTVYGEKGHSGVDMSSYFGAPIKAAADGVVAAKGSDDCPNFYEPECNYGFGNWIMIWHPKLRLHTVYSHLKEPVTKNIGLKVKQGEVIGHEGGSGFQFDTGTLETLIGDHKRHHLDFMVGKFKVYQTLEGKTDIQVIELYDPLKFLIPLK